MYKRQYTGYIGFIKIELYKSDAYYRTIESRIDGSSLSYDWTIPIDIPTGDTYQIKITSLSVPDLWGISPKFRITNSATDTSDTEASSLDSLAFSFALLVIVLPRFLRKKRKLLR